MAAGDWIKMRISLPRDGRVKFVRAHTGAHIAHVCGALYFLWATADEQSTSGKLWGYTAKQLDEEVGISGFAEALTMVCDNKGKSSPWLELGDGFISIPDYTKHNGATSKKRAQGAARASRYRNAGRVTKRAPRAEQSRAAIEQSREEKNSSNTAADSQAAFARTAAVLAPARQATSPGVTASLMRAGFDAATAQRYAAVLSEAEISGAVETLAKRSRGRPMRNPSGYLRKLLDTILAGEAVR